MMKTGLLKILTLMAALAVVSPAWAGAKPTSSDLVGRWGTVIEFGKFKFRMNLVVAKDGQKLKVSMDVPDQGQKGLPVNALLFNSPDVRIEIDQFGTAFNGKLSDDGSAIAGQFEEGPGGRPFSATFKKITEAEKPEPVQTFTFAGTEPKDPRGYWKASLEAMPGMTLRLGMKIGRLPDGTFKTTLDSFDQGMKDMPATTTTYSNNTVRVEWELMRAVFEAKLGANGDELTGTWKQGPKPTPVTFARLSKPATGTPEGLSFTPEKDNPTDVRGEWIGALDIEGNKLRLQFKLGKLPDGTMAGSVVSLDQGNSELPMTGAGFTNPVVFLEFKGIRGAYTGTLTNAGKEFHGTWEQFGKPSPLNLQRAPVGDASAKR